MRRGEFTIKTHMLNLFNHFKEIFFVALQEIAQKNNVEILAQDFASFIIEPAKEKSHGDLACNIAMTLSKKFLAVESLNNPRKLAAEIIKNINNESVVKLEIAGPGFINIFLQNQIFYKILGDLLQAKRFDFPNLGHGEKVNLEYASPNPTGPIHVGHTRGAIYGDVLAKLLSQVGYNVLKEYYINDAGSQIDALLKSAYYRYLERMNEIKSKDNRTSYSDTKYHGISHFSHYLVYGGDYLEGLATAMVVEYQEELLLQDNEELEATFKTKIAPKIRDFVIDEMINVIKADLAALGIKHDSYFSEKKELHDTGKIEEAIELLRAKGLIYVGKLEAPKTEKGVGALPEGYDDADQTLFRSTLFGDDVDRVVKKADGSYTYLAGDMAYAISKFKGGGVTESTKSRQASTKFIMPLGYDHAGYVKRLNAVVRAISGGDATHQGQAELKVILCQMVKFVKNGEPLKMSKRANNFITAKDVIDELSAEIGSERGADVLRFIMLTRKNDAPFDFDLAKVVEQSKDNPIFYVQYAHARCCSVLRNLKAEGLLPNVESETIDLTVLQNLQDESELEIIKKIVAFPRIVEMAVASYEPHRIAFYLQELSATFHALWNKGVENPDLKFIIPAKLEVTKSRIYLLMAIKIIIASGLDIFSIKALKELR